MRDFPVFTTAHGVASITLKELPYRGETYIHIRDTAEPLELLKDCVDFCKAVGAKRIYATGHPIAESYPLHTVIWQMRAQIENLPKSDARLIPVTEETLPLWRNIYNEKMASVPNASTMTKADGEEMLRRGDGYFVWSKEVLLGIGMANAESIRAVAAVVPGAGERVLCALCHGVVRGCAELEVARENTPAVRLYERLGFVKTAEISRWYKIYEDVK